jgi:hypothetical protein
MDDLLQSMPYNKDYVDTVDFSLEIETDVHPMQPLIKSPRYAVLQLADHAAVNEPDRAGMQRSIHQTGQAVPRIQNHHPLLDCDDCIGSDNDYNIKD